jgi:hypothetical protein
MGEAMIDLLFIPLFIAIAALQLLPLKREL